MKLKFLIFGLVIIVLGLGGTQIWKRFKPLAPDPIPSYEVKRQDFRRVVRKSCRLTGFPKSSAGGGGAKSPKVNYS